MSRTGCLYSNRHQGMTLIELMLVIAIIAILAAVAVPAYNNAINRQNLKAAAEAVLADIRWARSESIKRNVPVRVTFTTGANWSYTVIPDTNNDGTFNEATIKTASDADFPTTSMNSASFTGGVSFSTFNPVRGTAGNGSLVLTSAGNDTATVTVSVLGRSRICGFGGYEACN